MTTFDFKFHLEKIAKAKDEVEKSLLGRERFLFYDALPKNEQAEYKQSLSQFIRSETMKIRTEFEAIKQMK